MSIQHSSRINSGFSPGDVWRIRPLSSRVTCFTGSRMSVTANWVWRRSTDKDLQALLARVIHAMLAPGWQMDEHTCPYFHLLSCQCHRSSPPEDGITLFVVMTAYTQCRMRGNIQHGHGKILRRRLGIGRMQHAYIDNFRSRKCERYPILHRNDVRLHSLGGLWNRWVDLIPFINLNFCHSFIFFLPIVFYD